MGIYYFSSCIKNSLKSYRGNVLCHSGRQTFGQLLKVFQVSTAASMICCFVVRKKAFSLLQPWCCSIQPQKYTWLAEYCLCWFVGLVKLFILSLGRKVGGLGHEAAATNQSREGKNNNTPLTLKNRHIGILCVCMCVSKLSLFTTVEKTVRFSQKNTFTSIFFIIFCPSVLPSEGEECVPVFTCLSECISGPSDDLKGLLQLHDQLPIRFLHLVSEPVLQSVNGRPCDLKTQKINPKLSLWTKLNLQLQKNKIQCLIIQLTYRCVFVLMKLALSLIKVSYKIKYVQFNKKSPTKPEIQMYLNTELKRHKNTKIKLKSFKITFCRCFVPALSYNN